jgi:hypothetical protein
MLEAKITELDISASDLHKLASLTSILGQHVSALAEQKDRAGTRTSARSDAGEPPEPE